MENLMALAFGVVGLIFGLGIGYWISSLAGAKATEAREKTFDVEKQNFQDQIRGLEADLKSVQEKATEVQEHRTTLEKRVSVLETTLNSERLQSQEKLSLLNEAKDLLKIQFENLATQIFEKNSEKFANQSKANLDNVINPFKEKLTEFHKTVRDTHEKGSIERSLLEKQLNDLKTMNQRLSDEAENLTQALKGESKTRGIWGEMVLERILEESGLRKGVEYETQVSLKDEEGSRYVPDVIIRLPEEKDVVIDSKVSLNAWERTYSSDSEEGRKKALKDHLLSIRTHVKQLSEKNYQDLEAIRTLDYVLMFVPIETAFLAAMEQDPGLFDEAFKKRIVIVTPSTLMVTLKTIQNIWRYEQQNQNAKEIARQAGDLYDKFVGFVDSMDAVGTSITKAGSTWEKAFSQLKHGRGNLVVRAQKLKALGVITKKNLSAELVEQGLNEENEDLEYKNQESE
jgi:DNA recombination protein RmuC